MIVSIILAVEAGEPWRTMLLFVFAAVVVGAHSSLCAPARRESSA